MIEGIQSLNSSNIDEFIANKDGMILFHKTLCPNCKVMGKVLQKVQAAEPSIALAAVDTEAEAGLREKYSTERVPTIIVFKQGQQKASKIAVMNPKETLSFYKNS